MYLIWVENIILFKINPGYEGYPYVYESGGNNIKCYVKISGNINMMCTL